jgi:hypothetical protein
MDYNLDNDQCIDNLFEKLNSLRSTLILELKNDKECTKEAVLNSKLSCIDQIIRLIIRYRNINTKAKLKNII